MGIGLYVQAKIKGHGRLGRKPGRDRIFSDLKDTITDFVSDPLMRELLVFGSRKHTLYVRLHPSAEDVEFIWQPDQSIRASAKTSTTGPGYHAFLIDLMQHIGESMKLDWDWQENADEADFVHSGDFAALQKEMAVFWKSLGRNLAELAANGSENLMLNMPLHFPVPQFTAFAITPVGPLLREDCETIKNCEPDALLAIVPRFYIWWNRDSDAAFWRNTGQSLMWCDVPWHVPHSENERKICQLALDCMERAKQLDSRIDLPQAEIEELALLLSKTDDSKPQPPWHQGIGYRRHVMRHRLSGHWSLCFPGYYYEATEDDGSQLIHWFGDRTIHFSSFTISGKDDANPVLWDRLGSPDKEKTAGSEIVHLDKDHVQGWADLRKTSEDGNEYWMLQGQSACSNSMAVTTICYVDPADKDWAIETFKTIAHPLPKT